MTQTLAPGKWLGLRRTSTEADVFTILAFDQRGTYRRMLPPDMPFAQAAAIKSEVVSVLSRKSSAVLLDNEYGVAVSLHMARHSGLLYAVEKSGYTGDGTARMIDFLPDWNVAKIKQLGGSAVKLLAYYHPEAKTASEVEATIRKIADDCHANDIPLFLEPLSYALDQNMTPEAVAAERPQVVIETARRLSKVGPDILKMEFPYDAAHHNDHGQWHDACKQVSEACAVPWVLLSAGVKFETFSEQVRIACVSGASGFLAGRAIWKEAVTLGNTERATFLQQTALPRLETLTDIANQHARPWTDFYAAEGDAPQEVGSSGEMKIAGV